MSVNKSIDESANTIMDMVHNKYILFRNGIAYCENHIYIIEDIESGCVVLIKANSEREANIKFQKLKNIKE